MKPLLITIALLTLTPGAEQAPTRVPDRAQMLRITSINHQRVTDGPVSIDANAPVVVRAVTLRAARSAAVAVQAVFRRVYDGHVVVSERAHVRSGARGTEIILEIPPFHVSGPDMGKGWEVSLIVLDGRDLPPGPSDIGTISRVASTWSEAVTLAPAVGAEATVADGACGIEIGSIENVYGQTVAPGQVVTEVGLSSGVGGTLDMPKDAYFYLSVKPSTSDTVWLMSHNSTFAGRRWRGTAYFGRPEMDFGETFIVRAWMFRYPIAEDRQYSPAEWRAIEPTACASSSDVMVRRRVGPGDLKITKIDRTLVSGTTNLIECVSEPNVEGEIEDMKPAYALRPGETVWLLSRTVGTEGWTVSALAIVQPDRLSWRVPALRFQRPGDQHVMAVAAVTKLGLGRVLSADDWYRLASLNLVRRVSRTVTVRPVH